MEPGSFITTYSDTDSIALALTRTNTQILRYPDGAPQGAKLGDKINAMFLPIVKKDKKEVGGDR